MHLQGCFRVDGVHALVPQVTTDPELSININHGTTTNTGS